MEDFNASLVREKIVFADTSPEGLRVAPSATEDATAPSAEKPEGDGRTVIRSNRMFLKLEHAGAAEKIVIRAQNMHTTLRLASKAMDSFYKNGLFAKRDTPFDWQPVWEGMVSNYEQQFNPDLWAAVYVNGSPVFKTTASPFVDVVEKCALLTVDNYDATKAIAESALKQLGKNVRIDHATNVAAVFTDNQPTMRCGLIHRAGAHDTTLNMIATGGKMHLRVTQSLSIAAALLEAVNLRYVTRALQLKMRGGEIDKISPEAKKLREATTRLVALTRGISSFERDYEVKYRPEKPDFFGTNF